MGQSFKGKVGSASADGQPVAIAAIASPGTLLHTTRASAAIVEEVVVELANTQNAAKVVGMQWGGTAAKNLQPVSLDPYESRIVSGVLTGAVALEVRAYMISGAASDVNAKTYINEEDRT